MFYFILYNLCFQRRQRHTGTVRNDSTIDPGFTPNIECCKKASENGQNYSVMIILILYTGGFERINKLHWVYQPKIILKTLESK